MLLYNVLLIYCQQIYIILYKYIMILELKSLPYEARFKRLHLTTLEIRRIRGDLLIN